MRLFVLTACLASFTSHVVSARYNILSLDSAKYKGYMTAQFVSYMEQFAYNVARRDFCIDERNSERISMTELFDMISGSETGAIIATIINLPLKDGEKLDEGQKVRYFANKTVEFFEEHVDSLYRDKSMPWAAKFFIIILATGFIGGISYYATFRFFHMEEFNGRVDDIKDLIKKRKKQIKE